MGYLTLFIYLLSVFSIWRWTSIAYSKGGINEDGKTNSLDIFMVFCPIVNTVLCSIWIFYYPKKYKKHNWNYNKFFRIKK